jgi:stage V sporulation protein D (sporulation-specific penicillin-binding protein)
MPKTPKTDKTTAKKPSTQMNLRSYLVLGFMAILVLAIVVHMAVIQLVQGDDWLARARSQQVSDSVVPAKRGTIYDANMEPLAVSADAWRLIMSPKDIDGLKLSKYEGIATKDQLREYIADELSELLQVDREKLFAQTGKTNSQYEVVKSKVEYDTKEAFSKWVTENGMASVFSIIPDYKRYYPQGNLLSNVLGFTGTDNKGLEGLEASYNLLLSGIPGRIVTSQNGWGDEMPTQMEYSKVVDAEDGNSLVLTIDQTVQMYAEKYLEEAVADTLTTNRGAVIIQDVKTGGILAMATKGDYNPNNPFVIADQTVNEQINALSDEEEKSTAKTIALQSQWKNKPVSETYEPGSVFKVFTAAMALEEGAGTLQTSHFCPGYYLVGGWTIRCHLHGGHGTVDMPAAISGSCNPYFMNLGMRIGAKNFFKYFTAFGFTEKSGIDMSGETSNAGLYHKEETLANTAASLATAAFGQTNKVTPIQMITGISTIANGGKLLTPYVVQQVIDGDGNVVKNTNTNIRRQVVSTDTASKVSNMMEAAVNGGGCKSAYVAGYRVAGKTGTSEKRDVQGNEVVSSFAGFAPADDPQVAILVLLDQPQCAIRFGSSTAAPAAQKILAEVLPYLGVEPKYTEAELAKLSTVTPSVTGSTLQAAKAAVSNAGLAVRTVGSGSTVLKQVPEAGQTIPKGGTVVLYTDETTLTKTVTVPNFQGMSVAAANLAAVNAGLNLQVSGVGLDSGQTTANKQSIAAGQSVPLGTTITVSFLYKDGADGG